MDFSESFTANSEYKRLPKTVKIFWRCEKPSTRFCKEYKNIYRVEIHKESGILQLESGCANIQTPTGMTIPRNIYIIPLDAVSWVEMEID